MITCNLIMSLSFGEEDLLTFLSANLYIKESIKWGSVLWLGDKKQLERLIFSENGINVYENYVLNFILWKMLNWN